MRQFFAQREGIFAIDGRTSRLGDSSFLPFFRAHSRTPANGPIKTRRRGMKAPRASSQTTHIRANELRDNRNMLFAPSSSLSRVSQQADVLVHVCSAVGRADYTIFSLLDPLLQSLLAASERDDRAEHARKQLVKPPRSRSNQFPLDVHFIGSRPRNRRRSPAENAKFAQYVSIAG